MKFNWSHGHSTPKLVKVHGGKLGDTYFKPLPTNYQIVWQVRNEDFFALRWGVPDFIRQHIAQNGTQHYVGGYFVGSETYIPALDYFTAIDSRSNWKYAFERQWLFYKLWGRLLYDPTTPDAVFAGGIHAPLRRDRRGRCSTPTRWPRTPSCGWHRSFDSRWDFTLYSEGFLALQGEETNYIGVDALIKQPTMDPDYVSVADYVKTVRAGGRFAADRITPDKLADAARARQSPRARARQATSTHAAIPRSSTKSPMCSTWAYLGLHLAEKLRGAIALENFRAGGKPDDQQRAIAHLSKALAHWDEVIRITRPLYRDMKLTHYNGNSFDANPNNLFHWALIRDEVAQDVEVARQATSP